MPKLTELMNAKVLAAGTELPVVELFYEPETRRLRYAAVDAGGWFERSEVLVSIENFGALDADGHWPLGLTREEVEAAPHWHDQSAELRAADLPPLVVGPFGSTFSPMLMRAQMRDIADEAVGPADDPTEALMTDGSGRVFAMERAGEWLGREAYGAGGFLGTVSDLTLDDDLRVHACQLDRGGAVPFDRLKHMAEQGHAVFDVEAAGPET